MSPVLDDTLLADPGELASRDSTGVLRAAATAGAQVRSTVHAAAEAGLDALRGHEQALQAADLHALGAMALAGSDAAGARRAHAEADAARQRLRASLPAKLQTAFDARSAAVADAR